MLSFLWKLPRLVYLALHRPQFRAFLLQKLADQERREKGYEVPYHKIIKPKTAHHGVVGW